MMEVSTIAISGRGSRELSLIQKECVGNVLGMMDTFYIFIWVVDVQMCAYVSGHLKCVSLPVCLL